MIEFYINILSGSFLLLMALWFWRQFHKVENELHKKRLKICIPILIISGLYLIIYALVERMSA